MTTTPSLHLKFIFPSMPHERNSLNHQLAQSSIETIWPMEKQIRIRARIQTNSARLHPQSLKLFVAGIVDEDARFIVLTEPVPAKPADCAESHRLAEATER
mmetsp:Transcript_43183/g.115515  ORF Transcript_43183/g.115515 Transcript_43183/m.115515 type:complete len:101 (+) Transcript_43183:630-932(+)